MAASKPTASVAAPAEQHPVPYARRKRFVEQEASIYEIMTWGAAPLSPARYASNERVLNVLESVLLTPRNLHPHAPNKCSGLSTPPRGPSRRRRTG